jgi:hypothetical protein
MIDKRFPVFYSILLSFFIGIMTILMILLFIEYRFFCAQTNELLSLKQQYSCYIEILDRKINGGKDAVDSDEPEETMSEEDLLYIAEEMPEEMTEESSLIIDEIIAAERSDAPDNDDDYVDDSFVVINRHPDYLKQSTLDYMESQEMNALMTAIDIDRWSDYTDSFSTSVHKAPEHNKTVIKKDAKKIASNTNTRQQKDAKKSSAMRRPIRDCGFMWPIDMDKFWISSLFGPRKRIDGSWGFHHGVDMAAVKGTPVKAVRAGTVVEAAFQAGYGNTVVIKHSEAIKTRYAHLNAIRTFVGQKVKQSAIIGTVGETGFIRKKGKDGSHLHFEVYEHGKRVNPLHCLPRMT